MLAGCRKHAMTKPVSGARWLRAIASAAFLLSLAACGGTSSSADALEGASGPVDCQSVIDDSVTRALGWDMSSTPLAVVRESRCERRVKPLGVITAGRLDGSGSAAERYDSECARLEDGGHADADLAADVVGDGIGCAAGLDEATQTGLAELVFTQDDEVLQLRVDAEAPLSPDQLRSGLRVLAQAAQEAW
jgi:hypothetical protein